MKKISHVLVITLFLFTVTVGTLTLYPKETQALPFGGRVLSVTPCTNGLLVTIGPPTPLILLYPWGALSYLFGPPRTPGQWLLGNFAPGGVCNVGIFVNIPAAGTILFHGSSAI